MLLSVVEASTSAAAVVKVLVAALLLLAMVVRRGQAAGRRRGVVEEEQEAAEAARRRRSQDGARRGVMAPAPAGLRPTDGAAADALAAGMEERNIVGVMCGGALVRGRQSSARVGETRTKGGLALVLAD